jgi:penicillin-binding protein 2
VGENNNRAIFIGLLVVLLGIIFAMKLFVLQVADQSYKLSAESNTRRKVIQFPSRGLIYDRNGKLLVSNQAVYDIMIVPQDLTPFDTLDFCESIGITPDELRKMFVNMRRDLKRKKILPYKPSVFYKQLSAERYGRFQEKLYKFKGFFVQRRTLRKYEYPLGAHVLGYVGEAGKSLLKKDKYYSQGDYVGISGIEKVYEEQLRGHKGVRYELVDVHGRVKGSYRDGKFDVPAISGNNITLSLDIILQQYGEQLMQNKIGSIVAIEPKTGEVLTMVSAPAYDPSLLVGKVRSHNFAILSTDSLKPLFNRAVQARYPPGSTFKTLNALIGLEEKVLTPQTEYSCNMGYHTRALSVGCHHHASPLDLPHSIMISCNAYYCHVFRSILDNPRYGSVQAGLDAWKDYMVKFGFGYKLGVDVTNEARGFIPNSKYYDKIYRGSWGSLTVISLAIGQGEILTTPIQMANMASMLSNRGSYFTPHVIKSIEDDKIPERFSKLHETGIDTANFTPVIKGMELAVQGGPGCTAGIARIQGITVCGKTGTAQNPHGKDHSIFIAFAPMEDPKIAVAVYVENGGFGATWAAPIAGLMIEKYLKGEISKRKAWIEKRILEGDLIHGNKK